VNARSIHKDDGKMAAYLRGLLEFQIPDQLPLLGHAGKGTGGGGGSRG